MFEVDVVKRTIAVNDVEGVIFILQCLGSHLLGNNFHAIFTGQLLSQRDHTLRDIHSSHVGSLERKVNGCFPDPAGHVKNPLPL